ncbi:hypothetical protein V8C37DRAFT_375269, partial [Trichoderma ceciliae]
MTLTRLTVPQLKGVAAILLVPALPGLDLVQPVGWLSSKSKRYLSLRNTLFIPCHLLKFNCSEHLIGDAGKLD